MATHIGCAEEQGNKYSPKVRRTNQLTLPNRRLRTRSKSLLKKLRKNIEHYGIVVPLIVDPQGHVLDGCARLQIARELGLSAVPTIVVDGLKPSELKALSLSLNRLAEDAEWDLDALAETFSSIIEIDTDCDLELTGFDLPEIDKIILDSETRGLVDEIDQDIPSPPDRPVSHQGDIYQLGRHRIVCGDCIELGFNSLLVGSLAQVIVIDSPYNVPVDGHATGAGRIRHREFQMASGEMSREQFIKFLEDSLRTHVEAVQDGALVYAFMDWRHAGELVAAAGKVGLEPINMCVWVKSNGGMGSFYRSQHELVFVYRKGGAQHLNNIQLGKFGRNRTNVWEYEGASALNPARRALLEMHPTVKPVPMIEDILLDSTKRGDIVLDGFLGSGSALLAAERTGRTCHGIELDPGYVDVIIDRWQRLTGQDAIHEETGFTFRRLRARRHRVRPPAKVA